jgi:hypothetical protein
MSVKKSIVEPAPNISLSLPAADFIGDISTSEEALGKIMALLADESKKFMITELEPDEIVYLAGLLAVAEKYNIKMLRDFIYYLMLLRISKNRKGREEIINLGGARMAAQESLKQRLGRMFTRDRGV